MTDKDKLIAVLKDIGIPHTCHYGSVVLSLHERRVDVSVSIYFEETNNYKFHSMDGLCYRDHPQDYDPWDA